MVSAKYFYLFAALLLLSSHVLADPCMIDSIENDTFSFKLQVDLEGKGLMLMRNEIPYSYDCLTALGSESIVDEPVECEGEIINDSLFRAMDIFIISSECTVSYNLRTNHLVMETSSTTEKITKEENNFQVIRFNKWDLAPTEQVISNTLEVVLPEGSKIISYFPQENSTSTENSIFWSDAPAEPIGIKYTLPTPIEQDPLIIGVIVLFLLVIVGIVVVIAGIILYTGKKKKQIAELSKKEELLNKKLEDLRMSYLKRRINEETYKNLVEELSLKLTDIRVEKKSLMSKRQPGLKKKGKGKPKTE